MNSKEQIALNVIKAWIKRAEDGITIRERNVSFDFFDEGLKNFPGITTIMTVEPHYNPHLRVYQFDKIVEYLTNRCNGVVPYLPLFRENDTDFQGNYFIFDNIAFRARY